jgi:hypothetical protein
MSSELLVLLVMKETLADLPAFVKTSEINQKNTKGASRRSVMHFEAANGKFSNPSSYTNSANPTNSTNPT